MAIKDRVKDPRQLPVQLNFQVTWAFREFLIDEAERENVSLNRLCTDALMDKFGEEFNRQEVAGGHEQTKARKAAWVAP